MNFYEYRARGNPTLWENKDQMRLLVLELWSIYYGKISKEFWNLHRDPDNL